MLMSIFEDDHIKWLKRRRCSLTLDVEIHHAGEAVLAEVEARKWLLN
jgi:hypothetical protein